MGGHYLDLPVLEGEWFVFFIVQIELPHSEKQLVGVDAARRVEFFVASPPSHSPLNAVGCSYGPVFTQEGSSAFVQEGCWRKLLKSAILILFVNILIMVMSNNDSFLAILATYSKKIGASIMV